MKSSESEHLDKIRDRFTSSAESFAKFVLPGRADEAARFADMTLDGLPRTEFAKALDLACGPGTFSREFAERVAYVVGADFTPAMLLQAQRASSLANLNFVCADAYTLPFASGTFDVAVCCYAVHHLLEPRKVIREMARVVHPGGRIAIADIVIPVEADSDAHNHIERVRDPSHATTLSDSEFHRLFAEAGLRVLTEEHHAREREFGDWMRAAGVGPDTPAYSEARRLMEDSMRTNSAGFRPVIDAVNRTLQFGQTTLLMVGENGGEKRAAR